MSSATSCGGVDTFPSADSMCWVHGAERYGMSMLSGRRGVLVRKATRARRAGGGPFLQEKGLVSRDHWSRVRALLYLGGCHDCSTNMIIITTLAFKTWSGSLELESRWS